MRTEAGNPTPAGVSRHDGNFNFSVLAQNATQVNLCLFDSRGTLHKRIPLHSTGDTWHAAVAAPLHDFLYCYEVLREGAEPLKLADPYARSLNRLHTWRRNKTWPAPVADLTGNTFDWQGDRRPQIPLPDMVIYEAHVKGLTMQFPGMPQEIRGTYLAAGSSALIDHLKHLGVTTIELLPVFAKTEDPFLSQKGLHNYWGYNTLNYFSPESEYAVRDAVLEFKTMVRALHAAGIEIILDVVYNHTGEGGADMPAICYRGLADKAWYLTGADGEYIDYTHCGNTLNTENEVVRQMILDSLRYWVDEMHVDGFRFDLAPTLFRKNGSVTFNHELHHAITSDPVLRHVKLIVEPWDLGPDGYQRGRFPQPYLEWNDVFRDTARAFWKGDRPAEDLASILVHRGRAVINFITCHDGFTLRDLVSYDHKHNHANGEHNRDGSNHNHSFNCGTEGETHDGAILHLRKKQSRNLLMTLLFSQDIPMLLAGDEIGNSQRGNNNAYCQDNEISWLDWHTREDDLVEFVRNCLAWRRRLMAATHPHAIFPPSAHAQAFGIHFHNFILLMNASQDNVLFSLPGTPMREVLHTARDCHTEPMHGVCYVSAQSSVLLECVKP